MQYAATFKPYRNMAKPSLNVLSASWMDARSSRLDDRIDVSSARLPKGPSRKESGVEDAPRDCERAEMEPRDTLRKGVVGRLTDMMMVREEVVDVFGALLQDACGPERADWRTGRERRDEVDQVQRFERPLHLASLTIIAAHDYQRRRSSPSRD